MKDILHNDGIDHPNPIGCAIMMHIATLEITVTRLQKVREMNQNCLERKTHDLMIQQEQKFLSYLTQSLPAKDLMREMILNSND